MRRLSMVAFFLCLPSLAFAGAKEEGRAVFDKFLADFTSANADDVASLFTPDALYFGKPSLLLPILQLGK